MARRAMKGTNKDGSESGLYKITLGGVWSLRDFYELPHVFSQVYSFNCAFLLVGRPRNPEILMQVFSSFPWRGGYSAVNFYNSLGHMVPSDLRAKVKSIQYASPGWIELGLLVPAAATIGAVVDRFVKSAGGLNNLYTEIHAGMRARELMRINAKRREMELAREELNFVIESSNQLAKAMGFEDLAALNKRTGNPLASLKILLSYFRRIRKLADYAIKGKASFPTDDDIPMP